MTSIILNGIKSGELSKNMTYQYALQVSNNGASVTMWTDKVLCITSKGKQNNDTFRESNFRNRQPT